MKSISTLVLPKVKADKTLSRLIESIYTDIPQEFTIEQHQKSQSSLLSEKTEVQQIQTITNALFPHNIKSLNHANTWLQKCIGYSTKELTSDIFDVLLECEYWNGINLLKNKCNVSVVKACSLAAQYTWDPIYAERDFQKANYYRAIALYSVGSWLIDEFYDEVLAQFESDPEIQVYIKHLAQSGIDGLSGNEYVCTKAVSRNLELILKNNHKEQLELEELNCYAALVHFVFKKCRLIFEGMGVTETSIWDWVVDVFKDYALTMIETKNQVTVKNILSYEDFLIYRNDNSGSFQAFSVSVLPYIKKYGIDVKKLYLLRDSNDFREIRNVGIKAGGWILNDIVGHREDGINGDPNLVNMINTLEVRKSKNIGLHFCIDSTQPETVTCLGLAYKIYNNMLEKHIEIFRDYINSSDLFKKWVVVQNLRQNVAVFLLNFLVKKYQDSLKEDFLVLHESEFSMLHLAESDQAKHQLSVFFDFIETGSISTPRKQ